MLKYTVVYVNEATGYGWRKEYERLEDFEETINEKRADAMAYITVWDNELIKCIFRKGYGFKPEIDMLKNPRRDMRTRTRERR